MNLNSVFIAGNLTRDPDIRYTTSGTMCANFTIACNRRYRATDNQFKDDVSYIAVVAFGKTAEIMKEHFQKGSVCFVEGHIKQERWEDNSGKRHSKTKVYADRVQFHTSKKYQNNQDKSFKEESDEWDK